MKTLLATTLAMALAPARSFITAPDAASAAAPQPVSVTLTQEQLGAMMRDAAQAAVSAFSAKTVPVSGASVDGKRQVRLKAEVEPEHGAPVDRVGLVEKSLGRVLRDGKEDEVIAVRFGDVVEHHVASTLVGA